MKDNEKISSQGVEPSDSVVMPPILEDRTVLTTSGPVRDSLERLRKEQQGEREMIWDRRYLGQWVYKEE